MSDSFVDRTSLRSDASSLDVSAQGSGSGAPGHPTACFFHLAFKGAALAVYMLSSLLVDSFILTFVLCVLLLAFDFWTVKNVSGRLLVGLRWWNEVNEDGTNQWIYEKKPDDRPVNSQDSFVFWAGLYGAPVVWFFFGIAALFSLKLQWLLIVIVALVLSFANMIGYWRCQKNVGQTILTNVLLRV